MGTNVLLPENAFSVIRGTSKTLRLIVVDADQKPVDLTNASVVFTAKVDPQDRVPLIYKSSANSSSEAEITDPKGGEAKIYLEPVDTQNMDVGLYAFDVWAVLASGKRYCVVKQSVLELLPGVTVLPLS